MRRGTLVAALGLALGCSGVGPFESRESEAGIIQIRPANPVLDAIGARRQLEATSGDGTVIPSGNGLVWRSGAPGVATVDGNGMVTAVDDGTATITAELGSLSASTTVSVAATIETAFEVALDQNDPDPADNRVAMTITVQAP